MKKIYDLPVCDRKSWYGKAKVVEDGNKMSLQSYNTLVCSWNDETKTFEKLWDGYSVTTMRHINCFMDYIGLPSCGGKRWWESLECRKQYTISELVNI